MLTVDDIKKLTQVFATKQDLTDLEERLVSKIEFRNLFTLVEKVAGELKNIRQEMIAHRQEHDDINLEIKRLKSVSPQI